MIKVTTNPQNLMKRNSITENTSDLLSKPGNMATGALSRAYYSTSGKDEVIYSLSASALLLSQAITSIAAIPIQILAGIFSCLYRFSKSEWAEGCNELANGFITSGKHFVRPPVLLVVSIGITLVTIICFPKFISTRNTYNEWWTQ